MIELPADRDGPDDYLAYLLRLWRIAEEKANWRASLEDPHTGERLGFASLKELFSFLKEQTGTGSDTIAQDGREEK